MKILDYAVAAGPDGDELSQDVREWIEKGFQPFGGISSGEECNWLYQAMVKYE